MRLPPLRKRALRDCSSWGLVPQIPAARRPLFRELIVREIALRRNCRIFNLVDQQIQALEMPIPSFTLPRYPTCRRTQALCCKQNVNILVAPSASGMADFLSHAPSSACQRVCHSGWSYCARPFRRRRRGFDFPRGRPNIDCTRAYGWTTAGRGPRRRPAKRPVRGLLTDHFRTLASMAACATSGSREWRSSRLESNRSKNPIVDARSTKEKVVPYRSYSQKFQFIPVSGIGRNRFT